MITERQEYVELDSVEDAYARLDDWNVWQVKYDGIWARVLIRDGMVTIYSRTGQEKARFPLAQPEFFSVEVELIGEYMYGSQWAQAEGRKGKIFVFDCTSINGLDMTKLPYKERYRNAQQACAHLGGNFELVKALGKQHLGGFWLTSQKDYEGVILRKWDDPYDAKLLKLKYEVEDDFIVTGFNEGKGKYAGTLGSLVVSQYDTDEQLQVVMTVAGMNDDMRDLIWFNKEEYLSKVCLVRGKARFDSGALRHPNFICMRPDKRPDECRLKSKLS